jgi:hypothetical protein
VTTLGSNSAGSDENEPDDGQKHKNNVNKPENHEEVQIEIAGRRFRQPKLRKHYAGSGENLAQKTGHNKPHDQAKN